MFLKQRPGMLLFFLLFLLLSLQYLLFFFYIFFCVSVFIFSIIIFLWNCFWVTVTVTFPHCGMNKELFLSYNQEVFPDLIGSSMWADVELARSRTRIVDCAWHFFSVHQSLDLFPAWHTLPTLGLIQGFIDKWRIVIHLRLGVLALDPAKTKNKKKSGEYLLRVTPFRINVTH